MREDRLHSSRSRKEDSRTFAQIDRDRILYSSAFRRLTYVTQVVSPDVGHVFHNRLTHSLQVAQVGRRIAERLARPEVADPDVVEAACLAHDLGHPPFGHIAEEQLQDILKAATDGFEGNAQSFRIVTKLAFRSTEHEGLNLSRATLNALLKYPWKYLENSDKPKKWGAYKADLEDFDFARRLGPKEQVRSTEAEIMDWADDVTYSVHDVEDFFRAGRIPLHLLGRLTDDAERQKFFDEVFERRKDDYFWKRTRRQDLEQAFLDILVQFEIREQFDGSQRHRALLRSFSGKLIDRYVRGIVLEHGGANQVPDFVKEVAMLKELTWHYIINAPSMATYQHGQREIIKSLFEIFNEARETNLKVFPPYFREQIYQSKSYEQPIRAVADLISGLTEPQAIALYQQFKGVSLGFGLSPIV